MSTSPTPRITAIAAGALAILVTAGILSAHDFWIVPDAFQVASGGTIEVRGQTSTRFPTSESAVSPERLAEARLVGASTDERITDLSTSGRSLIIRHRPSSPGQRIVAVALAARSTRTTPARLQRYIALEGAPELAARYERGGAYPRADSVTQVSAKFAKTIVEVGSRGSRAFGRTVGHLLELVPGNDPASLRAGDTLVVRLLYRGRPVAGAHLHAGAAPAGVTARDSGQAAASPRNDITSETGPDGTARVPVMDAGLWNVRVLHAAPSGSGDSSALAWEVYFATLVFAVAPRSGSSGSGTDDARGTRRDGPDGTP